MSRDEARALLDRIRDGRELRVLGMDGEWGIRATGAGLLAWDHPAAGESIYGASADVLLSEDEAIAMLASYDAAALRAHLR